MAKSRKSIAFQFTILSNQEKIVVQRAYDALEIFGDILDELDDEYDLNAFHLSPQGDRVLTDEDMDKTAEAIADEYGTIFTLFLDDYTGSVQDEADSISRKDMETKLRKLLEVSSRVRIDLMRQYFKMDETTFAECIVEWAAKFGFKIDGDYITVENGDVNGFIDSLDGMFAGWKARESSKKDKMQEIRRG